MGNEGRQNVKWVEGVRGLASFFVVVTHLCRAWEYTLWFPRDNEHASAKILQLPFLRLPWQGRIGVTMFAFLTGYVCALKPLRQARSGYPSAALTTVAKSAFRRPPRLILPATFAMAIAWMVAQFGGFKVSNRCDSGWLRFSSPEVGSLREEIPRFFHNFQSVWINGRMEYDDHQWALLPLLKGAFMVYVTLCATIFMKFRFRMLSYITLYGWYWLDNTQETETFHCQMFFGMILCDLGSHPPFRQFLERWLKTRRVMQVGLVTVGVYVAGYPGEHPEWSTWSRQLLDVGNTLFPPNINTGKRWSAVGWQMCATAIWLSPTLQGIFSNRLFLWIGKNSFAVYLIHGTLLRVVLARMVYGWSGEPWVVDKNEEGEPVYHWLPRAGPLVFMVSLPLWFTIVYSCAHLWTTFVDGFCAKLTAFLERYMFESEDKKNGSAFV
ncbi:uncharacterized protein BDR25DRAFT_224716 [Lindgomyces ingoldianus]|uniref:Uncharacterized protein n=1 Tax=Lindgomyces ingoldianus TaxID=673940 RepID=A0ACB6QVR5_9PLEO|nr:uncharacterized protein BDR25DRAFT_224716 [Lindgomyces ingoldianus]KAF2470970.1 hypothetical protein BDR25DRAFT_224716 [Lindgomyces ingoldianus]